MKPYENFFHCVMCRNVVYLERQQDTAMHDCGPCGHSTKHFQIEVNKAMLGFGAESSLSRSR